MSLLKHISDKGAVLSWSPISGRSNLVALGTKDSSGLSFDDYGGELEIHKLDFSETSRTSSEILGKAKTTTRFASIAWSEMATRSGDYPYGLIAGGMIDGSIHVWDSAKLVNAHPDPLLASVQQHQGGVRGLQFNPHKESSHLLASGGADGEVFVMALDRPEEPNVFIPAPPPSSAKHTADVTKVAWNSQVAHILASSSQNGSCIVWDLRQKKAWCELREPTGGCVSDVAWNPEQGLHLVTASGDDKNPVIKLWDLRSSTTLPLATLQGHTEGVLSLSWCPTDTSLLLSCSKDNRTILWDLFHLQPVYDLPATKMRAGTTDLGSTPMESSVFGGLATSAGQKRFHVSWSPCLPAVVGVCSFDRSVQFYSLAGAKSRLGRAPRWLRRPVGTAFGFGGKMVYFNNKNPTAGTGLEGSGAVQGSPIIRYLRKEEDPTVGQACDLFHKALATGDFHTFCDMKSRDESLTAQDRRVWSLMRVICFEKNAREELLTHLGFDSNTIAETAQNYVHHKKTEGVVPPPPLLSPVPPPPPSFLTDGGSGVTAESLFGAPVEPVAEVPPPPPLPVPVVAPPSTTHSPLLSLEVQAVAKEMAIVALAGLEAEPTIRQALVVGNFAAAVECCLEAGLMAEALLLAQCGDPALCSKTQAIFFEKQKQKKPFLQILHAIIKGELMQMVVTSDLSRWKETLALLSTYGKSEEFPSLCEALALRLETEIGDIASATLVYMCATNVERVVHFWAEELKAANQRNGKIDSFALQQYVEKVVVYTHANPVDQLPSECSHVFSDYAALLAAQGRLDVAPKYLRGDTQEESILRDRIYHATEVKAAGARPPLFPFARVEIKEIVVQQPSSVTTPNTATAAAASATKASTASGVSAAGGSLKTGQSASAAITAGTAGSGAGSALPQGWIQLVDPSSGRPYYVNQATSQSQWEPPAVPVPAPIHQQQQQVTSQGQPAAAMTPGTPSYGAANTALKAAYSPAAKPVQNTPAASALPAMPTPGPMGVGAVYGSATGAFGTAQQSMAAQGFATQNPALMGARQPVPSPMMMPNPAATPTPASAPVQVVPEPPRPAYTPVDLESVKILQQIVGALSASSSLTPGDKRQLTMVAQGITVLKDKASAGEVSPEIQEQLEQFVVAINTKNSHAANAIQTNLANTAWNQHKDWIRVLKVLIPVACKKW